MSQRIVMGPAVRASSAPYTFGDVLADQIVSAISLGSIAVGERLPSEIELAAEFGVAVATLRKSLAVLREQGIVETRRGRGGGTFVVRVPFPSETQVRDYLANLTIVQIRDYGDEHMTIATGIARLACQRAHEQAIRDLLVAANRLESANSPETAASADGRFHIQLAVSAQSPRLLAAEMRLQSEISALKWSPAGAATSAAETLQDLRDVTAAVAAHDSTRVEQVIEEHIRKTVYRLIDVKLTIDHTAGQ
ncbi:FadR/GntR family transcriptional regulator [Gulosibacter chungangensis]|uniref:FadR family transcriptional regulator n=1 Tax=Gulosibacter chungangensis TaxID=979746 RepID=A0A7J5B7N5_9MICO|nr:GntR family transcriptional regulator [Gulosibacter chungangensis]KAB1640964.1 FadR family transcriptional regulator [Gulosibacter chungangensis]